MQGRLLRLRAPLRDRCAHVCPSPTSPPVPSWRPRGRSISSNVHTTDYFHSCDATSSLFPMPQTTVSGKRSSSCVPTPWLRIVCLYFSSLGTPANLASIRIPSAPPQTPLLSHLELHGFTAVRSWLRDSYNSTRRGRAQ